MRNIVPKSRFRAIFGGFVAALYVSAVGCGGQGFVSVSGNVTHDGQPVESGQIRFVPIGETKGPINMGEIVDGRYQIDARGGVPFGVYRVEIDAQKKTGRQVRGRVGLETALVDEVVRLGPISYAGSESPLKAEVATGGKPRFDFEIPSR